MDESCGKCTSCRVGSKRMHEILEKITQGKGVPEDIAALRTLAEHDRMEKALREAEKKYHSIFENAVEGIFQTAIDGRVLSGGRTVSVGLTFHSGIYQLRPEVKEMIGLVSDQVVSLGPRPSV